MKKVGIALGYIMQELTDYYKVVGEEEEDKAIYLLGNERERMIGRPSHPKENERGNDYRQLFASTHVPMCAYLPVCAHMFCCVAHKPRHGHSLYGHRRRNPHQLFHHCTLEKPRFV